MGIIVNVIGCETVYILNLLIIFPLIIQRRRKPRFASSLSLRGVFLQIHIILHSAHASTAANSELKSDMAIGISSPLHLTLAKYTAER